MKYHGLYFGIVSFILFLSGCGTDSLTATSKEEKNDKSKICVTGGYENVTENSALLFGYANLTSDMTGDIKLGVVCSTNPVPDLNNGIMKTTRELNADNVFSVSVTDLLSGTKYYYRAFVYRNNIYTYGEIKSFETLNDTEQAVCYSGIEAGTIASGIFTSDGGTKMTVVGNDRKYDVMTARRVLVSYETRPITDPAHIDIDILGLLDAGILQPGHVDTLPMDPTGSPLQVSDAWFSKEYLNILATFDGKDAGKHTFTATYLVDEKGISIRLDHDGTQDTVSGKEPLSIFLCIPMYEPVLSYDQYAQSSGKKPVYPAPVLLQWTARVTESGPLSVYERKGSYSPPTGD